MGEIEQETDRPLPANRYFLELGHVPEAVSLLDIWDALARRKKTILAVVAVFVGFFAALSLVIPVKYQANVVILENQLLDSNASGGSSSSSSDSVSIDVDFTVNEAIAMITSRSILSRYIEQHNLLPILFASDWDSASGTWAPRFWRKEPTVLAGYKKMADDVIEVSTDVESGLTSVDVNWTDPVLAQTWANSIVAEVNDVLRKRAIAEAEKSLRYLEKEIPATGSVEIQDSLFELVKAQKAKIVAANVYDDYAFRVIDPAVVPEDPAIPHLTLVLVLVGGVIGTFMGITLALLLNLIETARKSRQAKSAPDA